MKNRHIYIKNKIIQIKYTRINANEIVSIQINSNPIKSYLVRQVKKTHRLIK